MNAGFGSLAELKRHILAESVRTRTDWDAALTMIGQGVAAQFDRHCNRLFQRAIACTTSFQADQDHYYLPRYPIETITSIEQRDEMTAGFIALDASQAILQRNDETGLIRFGACLGPYTSIVRVTYTGGYWYDQTDNLTDTLPAAATQLPAEVKMAWLLQVSRVWELKDKLGAGLVTKPEERSNLGKLDLVPEVAHALWPFMRFAML